VTPWRDPPGCGGAALPSPRLALPPIPYCARESFSEAFALHIQTRKWRRKFHAGAASVDAASKRARRLRKRRRATCFWSCGSSRPAAAREPRHGGETLAGTAHAGVEAPTPAEDRAVAGDRETTPTVDVDATPIRSLSAAATQLRSNNPCAPRRFLIEPGAANATVAGNCAPPPQRSVASGAATVADADDRGGGGGPHMRLRIKTNPAIAGRARAR
jgi:hypothetical protein